MLIKKKSINTLGDGLPTRPTVAVPDPLTLRYMIIAAPGFGKTELFMSFPDSLLLACEEGHKMVAGHKIIIDCYDYPKRKFKEPWTDIDGNSHMSLIQVADLLEKSKRFKFIIIDTVDALAKMIVDYFTEAKQVEHLEDLGAYGRGYDLGQNSPFRKIMNKIIKTGRGIGYTTHQQINERTFKGKIKTKKETTLPSGILKLLVPQIDVAFHGEIGRKRKPNRFKDRILISEGNEELLAKNRGGIMPNKFILPYKMEDRWLKIKSFFDDKSNIEKAEKEYEKIYGED